MQAPAPRGTPAGFRGWPGPGELAFFALAALLFALPAIILPVPLDTDAQGFGYLALMARLDGSFDSLAPFRPEISYLYAPGFTLLSAWLSAQLGQPLHTLQHALAAVLGLINVWLAFDLGAELRDRRLGRAMAFVMLLGGGLFLAYMDSHFTTLLGLVFAQASVICALRWLRAGQLADALGCGLMLASLAASHPDTAIILALGLGPWLLTLGAARPRPSLRRWLVLVFAIPLLALALLAPWLLRIAPLLGAELVSPFVRSPDHARVMLLHNGIWPLAPALVGAWHGLRRREPGALLAIGWLALCVDFAVFGLVERLAPWLPLFRYDYPFSIAWHGPVIPLAMLAGAGLLTIHEHLETGLPATLLRLAPRALLLAGFALTLGAALLHPQLLAWSRGRIGFFGAFASAADVAAMTWLRENAPPDARVLNFPGVGRDDSHESDWAPVISERDTVYYRWQPFFRGNETSIAEQERLRAFWADPADPAHAALLAEAGIDYVLVPQIVGRRGSFASAWRWREPLAWRIAGSSTPSEAPWLELVFEADGAQVHARRDSGKGS